MKRFLPAPLLSAALFALWMVLAQELGADQLLLAAFIAVAMPLLSAPLRPLPVHIRRPGVLMRLVLTVGGDVIVSNLKVGWSVLNAGRSAPRGSFVAIPLELRDANGLAALAMITTVVPGTVWCELALDRSALLLHVFDLHDEADFVAQFKARYERPLMEIFE